MSTVQPGGTTPGAARGPVPAAIQAGSVVVDRYRLEQSTTTDLADASVWQARDQILDRPVRITFLGGPNAASALDAARRAALVSDPRLARVLDVGTTTMDGVQLPYVITEPYTGSTLAEIVSGGLVDGQQARAVVGEAAAALDVAAQRGVHHLALRPDAVRVDGHRVVVTGLGLDAGLAGVEGAGPGGAASDARDLAALAYYALTARWAGDSLDEPWLANDVVRPLPAQVDASGDVVPLSSLVPHVDPVLDSLVQRAIGTAGDAPASPAEVAAALRPWGEVSVVASLPEFVRPPASNGGVPIRQSVRTGSAAGGPPTVPGAPPVRRPTGRIARAGSIGVVGAAGVGAAAAGAATAGASAGQQGASVQATPAVPPPPPPAPPAYGGYTGYGSAAGSPPAPSRPVPQQATQYPSGYGQQGGYPQQTAYAPQTGSVPTGAYGAGSGQPGQTAYGQAASGQPPYAPPGGVQTQTQAAPGFASESAPPRRGVNPTPIVLSLVVVGVILGAGWAISKALKPFDAPLQANPTVSASAGATSSGSPSSGDDETSEPPTPEVRPIIASGAQVDPEGNNKHAEIAGLAVDGDPSTFWYTQWCNQADFDGCGKSGIGYAITLREPAPISSVTLMTNSVGGHVVLRKTDPDKPKEGAVLAEGAFGQSTELKLKEPVSGTTFVLWIDELPVTKGKNYLELDEIVIQ